MSDAVPPAPRLRVTSGPLRGATFPLIDGLVIGRSPNVDVLVLAPGVRPRHAEIRETGSGCFMLSALDETAELHARGEPVRRVVLTVGVDFEIAGNRFEVSAPPSVRPNCEYIAGRGEVPADRPSVPVARLPRIAGPVPRDAYQWPLVADLLAVRRLWTESGRGKALGPDDARELAKLTARLSLGFAGARPRFLEFSVDAPAVLRFSPDANAPGMSVRTRCLGVEGMQIRCDASLVEPGQRVWVEVRPDDPRDRVAIFAGRVAATSDRGVRIAFTTPYDEARPAETTPTMLARLRAA